MNIARSTLLRNKRVINTSLILFAISAVIWIKHTPKAQSELTSQPHLLTDKVVAIAAIKPNTNDGLIDSALLQQQWPSQEVQALLGVTNHQNHPLQIHALNTLLDRASEQDLTFLVQFLRSTKPKDMPNDTWRSMQNIIIRYFAEESKDPAKSQDILLSLLDTSPDEAMRINIVNNIHRIYSVSWEPKAITERLWALTAENNLLGASALVAVSRIHFMNPSLFQDRVEQSFDNSLKPEDADAIKRTFALQLAAELKIGDTVAASRNLLRHLLEGKQAQGNELIYISAMATVAQEANPADLPLLKKIASRTDFPKEITDGARAIISTLEGEDNF